MKKGKCGATIVFRGGFGQRVTFLCELPADHNGLHLTNGDVGECGMSLPYLLTWQGSYGEIRKAYSKMEVPDAR